MKRYLISLLLLSAALGLAGCDGRSRSTSMWTDGDCSAGAEGEGTAENPYLICTAKNMNAVRGGVPGYEGWGLDKHYKVMQDIDLSGYAGGAGWVPIGTQAVPFTGSFDGNGRLISNLTITGGADYQGLFGYTGSAAVIKNAALSSVNVNGGTRIGSLAGYNNGGTIINCSATGTVSGDDWVGGLVGVDNGTISDSHASVTVTGGADLGGLVAFSRGQIIKSYATGTVSGGNRIGGLVSQTTGTISDSYATGTVNGATSGGGLVGWNNGGTISTSYSAGTVSGSDQTGGLVGTNGTGSSISDCYATGTVSGGGSTGGLVGYNLGTISTSYSAGTVSGISPTGGLVGRHDGSLIISSYWISDNTNGLLLLGGGTGSADLDSKILSDTFGKQQISFINWDFTDIWRIKEGVSYPELQPYPIYTAEELNAVRGGVAGYEGWGPDKHYKVMQDIDLTGYAGGEGWEPIGTAATPFTGVFDGNGKVISNLTINRVAYEQGLFGRIGPTAVLKNAALSSVNVAGGNEVGSLAGSSDGTIINCSATGTVSATPYWAGGLVGGNSGTINDSHATVTVSGQYGGGLVGSSSGQISNSSATGSVSGVRVIGGLVGYITNASISGSYATGAVEGNDTLGGLVGHIEMGNTISNSYATGTVTGIDTVGGLAGISYSSGNTISNSYAMGTVNGGSWTGGLVGNHSVGSISSSYWITENANGLPLLGGGTGIVDQDSKILSATFGKQQASFINWDFVNTWRIEEGVSYPELQWQQ